MVWMAVSSMLTGMWLYNVVVIFPAATMTASAGVTAGFVIYLCLKHTVSDTLLAFVLITHKSQHR